MALLLGVQQGRMLLPKIASLCDDGDLLNEVAEKHERLLLVVLLHGLFLVHQRNRADLGEELDGLNARACRADEVAEDFLNQVSLEHVAERNPRQKGLQRLQALPD